MEQQTEPFELVCNANFGVGIFGIAGIAGQLITVIVQHPRHGDIHFAMSQDYALAFMQRLGQQLAMAQAPQGQEN